MTQFLFDTSVLLDLATPDPQWLPWSTQQFRSAPTGSICINPIIYAELAPAFATEGELDRWLSPLLFTRLQLPYAAGWRAGQAFVRYRRAGGAKHFPLPDFYVGAQAEVDGLTLVTRDAARYRTYFPTVNLITP